MIKQKSNWLKEIPIAHRGLHSAADKIIENSMEAFENAIRHGYAIELDVQVIKDEEVIVFHDYNLERLCGYEKNTRDLTTNSLRTYPFSGTTHLIPLLKDVLALVNGRVPILIEIKKQSGVKHSNMIILNSLLGYKGQFAIQSFDPFILGWFAKNAPLIVRGQLSSDFKGIPMNGLVKYLLNTLRLNFISKPHFIAYDIKAVQNNQVRKHRKKGLPVIGWTVSTEHELANIVALYDNIIFENFRPEKSYFSSQSKAIL